MKESVVQINRSVNSLFAHVRKKLGDWATAQHSTAQHSTAQHSTASPLMLRQAKLRNLAI